MAYLKIGRAGKSPDVLLRIAIGKRLLDEVEALSTSGGNNPPVAVPATNEFMVELGKSIGLPEMARRIDEQQVDRATVVTVDSPKRLPDQWYGYEGIDLLAVAGAAAIDKSMFDPRAVDAIEHWVRLGGTLLIACGDGAERLFGTGAPLARFAPGELDQTIDLPLRNFRAAIETFAAADEEERLEAKSLRAPQWKTVHADRKELEIGMGQTSFPLVFRSSLGFGQVLVVGLDLHTSPLAEWPARTKFLERLLGRRVQRTGRTSGQENFSQAKRLGFIDISGQLRAALDQFADVQLVPFWAVAATALIYIGLLFPLNYFVIHRWLKRQWIAWFVFSTCIVLFSVAAYAWANRSKGDQLHANQLDLIDVDVNAGLVRGTTWFNLFSAENARYDLTLQPQFTGMKNETGDAASSGSTSSESSHSLLSWLGLHGTGLGGMSSAAVNAPLFDEPYVVDRQQGNIVAAPVSIWSSKNFIARWDAKAGGAEAALTATAGGQLRGTLTNRLDAPLRNCVVFFGGLAYPLEDLNAGQTVQFDRRDPISAAALLTERPSTAGKDQTPPYNRACIDPLRILQVMMFYDLAGGANYSGLLNRFQSFVDLSNQLNYGRAILVGRGPAAAPMQLNGQPLKDDRMNRHDTVYRFVLPVKNH